MTAARQERKSRRRPVHAAAILGMVGVLLTVALPARPAAVDTDPVVSNRYTGLAIDGFDPVAYFVDKTPRPGAADFELRAVGANWRFVNEGNRAAFKADPETYAPRFGGHDPVAIVRGAATPGHPALWLIAEDHLYLFHSEESRAVFAADPDRVIEAAERRWPAVRRTLPH